MSAFKKEKHKQTVVSEGKVRVPLSLAATTSSTAFASSPLPSSPPPRCRLPSGRPPSRSPDLYLEVFISASISLNSSQSITPPQRLKQLEWGGIAARKSGNEWQYLQATWVSVLSLTRMGSLCCVAARPHGTSTASREWSSIGRSDPLWRTNAGYSPPLSRRWEYRINSEGLSYGSHGDSGVAANYGSSLSSNSKEASRSWERNELPPDLRYSTSEGAISYFNSPDVSFQNHHIMLPMLQDSSVDEFVRVSVAEPIGASLLSEGMSGQQNSGGSTSSRSDGSECDIVPKSYSSTPRNFPSRRSFLSKPIHPLSFLEHALEAQEIPSPVASGSSNNPLRSEFKGTGEFHSSGLMDYGSGSHGESTNWSAASSMDLTDFSERPEAERAGPLRPGNVMEKTRCDLCERLLTKRSPWGSRRIVRTGDLPVAGVLPCCHVYHAECLERTTPKGQKHDPPCPVCDKLAGKDTEQWSICRLKNGFPRLRSLGEGPSRIWSCAQAGDCVAGAVQIPRSSSIALLSWSGHKRHAASKGEPGKDWAET